MRKKTVTMPVIPVKGLVVFPFMVLHIDITRKKSILALEEAMLNDQNVILIAQKNLLNDEPKVKDLHSIGTIVNIKQVLKLPNGNIRMLVEGVSRASIKKELQHQPYISADICPVKNLPFDSDDTQLEASMRQLHAVFDDYTKQSPRYNDNSFESLAETDDYGALCDVIAANLLRNLSERQTILSELDVKKRIDSLIVFLSRGIEVLKAENELLSRVKGQMDDNQREYFLREHLKAVQKELGDKYGQSSEADDYAKKLEQLNPPKEVREKIEKEIARLQTLHSQSSEVSVVRSYLDLCLSLPWNVSTPDNNSLSKAIKVLERDHYGLSKVKERIVEYLAVRLLSGSDNSIILCLNGPPGVGKTSIAKSIAQAIGRKYSRISLGGVRDEADIRGHRKTYVAAMPGRIINAINMAGSKNPVILLDEIDKMGSDFRGDPSAALLEVLDSEQNHAFRDHFLELPFDLSGVLFITTANDISTVPRPLLDRMEVIDIGGYTNEEKVHIAVRHLIPKQLIRHGLSKEQLKITRQAVMTVCDYYTREAGVRNLERELSAIIRKSARKIIEGENSINVGRNDVEKILGKRKYRIETGPSTDRVGVCTGLAWTSVGGDTMDIEVNVMDGKGDILLTGKLGDVMQESAKASISFIRANAAKLNVDKDFYKKYDIHIHVPEGAVPKDGPSAGITMATALVSALTGCPVKHYIAMTGEITLRGRVLPIGGLKEKALAAYRAGIKEIIIPAENNKDLEDVPQTVKDKISFYPVSNTFDVLEHALRKLDLKVKNVCADQSEQEEKITDDFMHLYEKLEETKA